MASTVAVAEDMPKAAPFLDVPLPSPEYPAIQEALADVMAAVRSLAKDEKYEGNRASDSYNFRGVDSVMNALGPALREARVILLPHLVSSTHETVLIGRNQTPMGYSKVTVRYRFVGPRGDHLDVQVPGEAMDSGDKAIAKAMSVALRIALLQTFVLPTDEPDPDSEKYERSTPQEPKRVVIEEGVAGRKGNPTADAARAALIQKMRKLNMSPDDVAQMFHADTGQDIKTCADAKVIKDFTERLAPGE